MVLYQLKEYQRASGKYGLICENVLGQQGNHWHLPARVLGLTPEKFIILITTRYNATIDSFNKDKLFITYSWKTLEDARKFKNLVNRVAKQKDFKV